MRRWKNKKEKKKKKNILTIFAREKNGGPNNIFYQA
jgi:hypothetical protein